MKSSTSCSTQRTARVPMRIGFGEPGLGHQRVDGRAGQRSHRAHVAEREKSRGHVCVLPLPGPALRSAIVAVSPCAVSGECSTQKDCKLLCNSSLLLPFQLEQQGDTRHRRRLMKPVGATFACSLERGRVARDVGEEDEHDNAIERVHDHRAGVWMLRASPPDRLGRQAVSDGPSAAGVLRPDCGRRRGRRTVGRRSRAATYTTPSSTRSTRTPGDRFPWLVVTVMDYAERAP